MTYGFDADYICVVEEDIDTYYCVTVPLAVNFSSPAASIISSVREKLLFIGGSGTTLDENSSLVTDMLSGVLEIEASSIDSVTLVFIIGYLGVVSVVFLLLNVNPVQGI